MRFSWTGLILAPLLSPVLFSAVFVGLSGSEHPVLGFLSTDRGSMLDHTVRSLLSVYACLKDQIRHLDRQLLGRARESAV